MFSREDGQKIAKKLSATMEAGRRHDLVVIRYQGKRVAQYGLRRGSGELSHSYIPRQLYVSQSQCRALSDCPMSADEYFALLKQKGLV